MIKTAARPRASACIGQRAAVSRSITNLDGEPTSICRRSRPSCVLRAASVSVSLPSAAIAVAHVQIECRSRGRKLPME